MLPNYYYTTRTYSAVKGEYTYCKRDIYCIYYSNYLI